MTTAGAGASAPDQPGAGQLRATGPQTQDPILTVTLNPALDLATSAARVVPELKLRCDAPLVDPGGGGINVSRAIDRMGGRSTAFVALGGPTGARNESLIRETGLDLVRMDTPGDTRQSLSVTDRETGGQYRFVLPGPDWTDHEVAAALQTIAGAVPDRGLVVLSGSNPPGVPAEFASLLADHLRERSLRLVVDTSGAALAAVATARGAPVTVLRMDAAEAEALFGSSLSMRADTAGFARALAASGAAEAVIIARGADGNIIATADGSWHAEAAPVTVVSKVGAGDSFVGGFALAMARGWDAPDALALGAAAASATCLTPATELCHAVDVERLFAQRVVTPI
ncbi:hexose kinase [uncultured Paracoccus sp.]|uniref:1-phosphofructokinase family hexose kinase n=1 Tax=uncultured Paracoccus sp. TaxID=189685 RepID=UPI00260D7DBA|nr:hexose kinase [uncultured Paracoccus sp.]